MGQMIQAKEIKIQKLETPKVANLKTRSGQPYTRTFHYTVTVLFHGSSISANAETLEEAFVWASENQEKYEPSWEEVTDNGRYSCD